MFDLRNVLFGVTSFIRYLGLALLAAIRGADRKAEVPSDREWWERPGLGIMYQIETHPGWAWDRDYIEFNKSMADEQGNLKSNGPFCNMEEWVQLSTAISVDYHSFEVKWHDGICYFNTPTTKWKTQKDYTREFAKLSRDAGIPFMFYYSAVFDHNPQFDSIQPKPRSTPSLIGNRPEYREYMKKHYAELIDQYRPDGMWVDWYWADGSTTETVDYFRKNHPDVVLAFNLSNLFPASFKKLHFTSLEAHRYDGPWVKLRKEDSLQVPVFTSAVKWSNAFRMIFDHQWELISPAGKWWQDQSLREDPLELIRSLAVVLACGGKLCIGATSQMDGRILPDQTKQLRMLGDWYRPRKKLFVNAAPIRYRWFRAPGVRVSADNFDTVVSSYGAGVLLHVINRKGSNEGIAVTLRGSMWRELRKATLKPQERGVSVKRERSYLHIDISPEYVDPVDTILYLTG